jgi:cytochrome c oxidase subunit 1
MSVSIPMPYDHVHARPHGWCRWQLATHHRDIGTLHILVAFTSFLFKGVTRMMLRAELFEPGLQIIRPEFSNQQLSLNTPLTTDQHRLDLGQTNMPGVARSYDHR